jgi:Kef-type K+ transport system membrane component KefB
MSDMLVPAATQVQPPDMRSIVLVLLASALAALLSRIHYWIVIPTVVLEIVLGIVIGPDVLRIAESDSYLQFRSGIGLAFLFFFAGLEVVEKKVPRDAVLRGTGGWALSLALGLLAGAALTGAGLDAEWWLVGVALATTSLGTLVPILSDACFRRPSGERCSEPASRGSSGRSWSSRCSSRVSTAL